MTVSRARRLIRAFRSCSRMCALVLALSPLVGILGCADDEPCAPAECGPMLPEPTFPCEDGSIGGDTRRCLRNVASDSCGWELRECPPVRPCGGSADPAGVTCPAKFFCAFTPEAMCGSAGPGVCHVIPESDGCAFISSPVCGCDGITYDNGCEAGVAGVAVLHRGDC